MNRSNKIIYVYADWEFLDGPVLMGTLHSEIARGSEIFSFEYEGEWLDSERAQILDPELKLYSGRQYLYSQHEKPNFGIFLDSSPDRWGRVLMRRKESALAKQEGRKEKRLLESDYLLGVYDQHRTGAIRFKEDKSGSFLNDDKNMAIPPWTSIRELEEITYKLETEEAIDDPEYIKWLNILLAPGSSLGGARPKASVLAPDGSLWIAKFPSKNDSVDIGAWEMVANEIAQNSGINVTESYSRQYAGPHHSFLTKRFDRTQIGKRKHFASAMTMLGYFDRPMDKMGISYLEIVDFIEKYGANVNADLQELWSRIVFNICISNTDDHLRNHGFILTPSGWVLSPAYDLNPNELGNGLSLNITENDNSLNTDLAMEVHPFFRLKEKEALKIIEQVKKEVSRWRKSAKKYEIPKTEQELKANAFLSS